MNMKFIKIKDKIYSTAIIQRLGLNGHYITFFILDGVKLKQVDVKYESKEHAEAEFNKLVELLNDKGELFELNP